MLIPRLEIEAATSRIRAHLPVTPLVRADHFSRKLGANVFFKLETLQPTHSFKVRGAFNALLQLSDEQRKRGVVTASGGNHGLAVAHAARVLGIPATIYLPESATSCSVAALVEGRIAIRPGENVVVVLCGANVALENVRYWAGVLVRTDDDFGYSFAITDTL